MNKKGVNNFWKEYIKTNEMEQSKMLDELTMFQHKDKQGIFLAFVTKQWLSLTLMIFLSIVKPINHEQK